MDVDDLLISLAIGRTGLLLLLAAGADLAMATLMRRRTMRMMPGRTCCG